MIFENRKYEGLTSSYSQLNRRSSSDLEVRRCPALERVVHGIAVRPVGGTSVGRRLPVVEAATVAGCFSAFNAAAIFRGTGPLWLGAGLHDGAAWVVERKRVSLTHAREQRKHRHARPPY